MNTYNLVFERDSSKERVNIIKHGIDFKTASHIFLDQNRIEILDQKHSDDENRYITIGMVQDTLCVLNVVYVDREDTIRIITARKATRKEIELYNEHDLL